MSQNVTFLSLCFLIQIYCFENGPNVTVTSQIISTPNLTALFYDILNNSRKVNFGYYQMSTLHATFLIMVSIYNCAIFRTLALLATLTGVQLTRRVEASPALSEHHYCIKFSIQNIVLRVSTRKNSKMFLCEASFSCFFSKMFTDVF